MQRPGRGALLLLAGLLLAAIVPGCGGDSGRRNLGSRTSPGLSAGPVLEHPAGSSAAISLVGPAGEALEAHVIARAAGEDVAGRRRVTLSAEGLQGVAGFSVEAEVANSGWRCVAAEASRPGIASRSVSADGRQGAVAGASLPAPQGALAALEFEGAGRNLRARWSIRLYDERGRLLAETPQAPTELPREAQAADYLGDLDGDGVPTVGDAIRILRIAAGLEADDPRADVDQSGTADVSDAIRVLRCIVGLDPWPIGTVPPPGGGSEFHVSPDGDDAQSGAADDRWCTVQHAADEAQAGDTVIVHEGSYPEDVSFGHSGSAGARITFAAAAGADVTVRSVSFEPGTSHVRLDGFTVTGDPIWGVSVLGGNQDLRLAHLTISGGEAGMRLTVGNSGEEPFDGPVSGVVIEDCVIRDTQFGGVDGTPGPCDDLTFRRVEVSGAGLGGEDSWGSDGIAVERGQNILVEDCNVHDNGGDGIDLNSRDFGGHVPGIVVRGNVVARNHLTGIKLWAGGRIEGNAVWGQGVNPLPLGTFDSEYELIGNTIAYNMWSSEYGGRDYAGTVGYPESDPPPQVLLTMRDNIWAFNTGPAQGTPTGLYLGPGVELVEERDNVFFSRADAEIVAEFLGEGTEFTRADIANGSWALATGQGAGDLTVDPLFVSGWPNVDLSLQPGSPAAGRGAY